MTGTTATPVELLADCNAHGIGLALSDGDGLEIDAPQGALTPDLLARLKAHKADLLAMLRTDKGVYVYTTPSKPEEDEGSVDVDNVDAHHGDAGQALQPQGIDAAGWTEYTTPDGRRGIVRADAEDLEAIDPPSPCPRCGSVMAWWDVLGGQHCMVCDAAALARSRRLAARAAELRRRNTAGGRRGKLGPA